MTEKQKLRATFVLGLVPLLGGLTIFFWWWIGKAWFLTDLNWLETAGFFWIPIAGFMGVLGIIIGIICLWQAKGRIASIAKALVALAIILMNIPALVWVLDMQQHIDYRAYVRIYNQSGEDFSSVTINNSLYTRQFGALENNDHKTGYFYPNYKEFDSNYDMEEVKLTLINGTKERIIVMPEVYKGTCEKFVIDSSFKIREVNQ